MANKRYMWMSKDKRHIGYGNTIEECDLEAVVVCDHYFVGYRKSCHVIKEVKRNCA